MDKNLVISNYLNQVHRDWRKSCHVFPNNIIQGPAMATASVTTTATANLISMIKNNT